MSAPTDPLIQPHFSRAMQALQHHRLVPYSEGSKSTHVEAWSLRQDGSRMLCVEIVFLRSYICITGDYTPIARGVVSDYGYGCSWFRADLSPSYLAEKFLSADFQPKYAARALREEAAANSQDVADESVAPNDKSSQLLDWAAQLDGLSHPDEWGAWAIRQDMARYEGFSLSDMGINYCPRQVGVLCAIQHRFRDLFPTQ